MTPKHNMTDRDDEQCRELCSVVGVVKEIGSEWRLIILYTLQDDEMRFNELEDRTDGSSSTISRVLRELEDAGLVKRRVEDRPLATYYSLTERGQQLSPVFDELDQWGTKNLQTAPETA